VLTASGPGYRSPPARIAGGQIGYLPVEAPVPPPRPDLFGRVCVRNAGRTTVTLVGTEEFRTATRAATTVDGKPVAPDLALTLFENRAASVPALLPEIVDRVASLRGFLGHPAVVWLLLALVVVAVPAAMLAVLYRALAGEQRPGG